VSARPLRDALRTSLQTLRRLSASAEEKALQAKRDAVDGLLADLSVVAGPGFEGTVLVDATWDNPNYWLRYALVRAALGLAAGDEVGLLGPFHADRSGRTLRRFGVRRFVDLEDGLGDREAAGREARRLLSATRTPDDMLAWTLPEGIPPHDLYDGVLKRQRHAVVDLQHPQIEQDVTEYLLAIGSARRLLDDVGPRLLVTAHTASGRMFCGPAVWLAARRGIRILVPYGGYGVLRLYKINRPDDIFSYANCPTGEEIDGLPSDKAESLARLGREYISLRLGGKTQDLASVYAFHRGGDGLDREAITSHFGWPRDRPIVAVYASTWFDNPHAMGMTHFRDFVDWLRVTFDVARGHRAVSWLFRRHPCDDWYGGVTLKDLLPDSGEEHVRQCPPEWNGGALTRHVDGLVSLQGTAGVEYACSGKPVLVGDRGWYHDRGFVVWPRSREDYLAKLTSPWWQELDLAETARRAQIFAGWYFGRPTWQGRFHIGEDSDRDALYETMPALLEDNRDVVRREIEEIRRWYDSEHRLYHTFKMRDAGEYALPG
jgi:hypothetical protein